MLFYEWMQDKFCVIFLLESWAGFWYADKKAKGCHMKYIVLTLILFSTAVVAQTMPVIEDCELSIAKAEQGGDEVAYTRCGFDDENLAFSKWSGFVSQKQMPKGMYELCMRHPTHEYSPIYCQKAADLGYGPALAELGHRAMNESSSEAALRFYTRALATKQLNPEQEGKIAEQLGVYYLQPGDHYVPAKAVAFLQTAAKKRSALANNALGYFAYTGELGVKQAPRAAFSYFWRAILLGCPAAEENIGLFHLARHGKLSTQQAAAFMQSKALTCEPAVTQQIGSVGGAMPVGCRCDTVLELMDKAVEKPYTVVEISGTTAKLKDKQGATQSVQQGQALASGYTVAEVRQTVVILTKDADRVILNKMPDAACVSYCQTKTEAAITDNIQIKPYRITFTPTECRDIMYYAEALVDTAKPFVGKEQCAGDTVLVQDPLLDMLAPPAPAPSQEPAQATKAPAQKVKAPTQKNEQKNVAPKSGRPMAASKTSRSSTKQGDNAPTAKKEPKFFTVTVGDDVQKDVLNKAAN